MNLAIRKIRMDDAADLKTCLNDKKVIFNLEGMKYPFGMDDSKKYIMRSLKDKNTYEFAILADGSFVGTVVLEKPNKSKTVFELGYFIAKPWWGKGIATMAVKRIVAFGFYNLKLKKIWAGVSSNNPSSRRVLEKAGFRLEKILKNKLKRYGKYCDELVYGIYRKSEK